MCFILAIHQTHIRAQYNLFSLRTCERPVLNLMEMQQGCSFKHTDHTQLLFLKTQ